MKAEGDTGVEATRVLVASELRSYREAIAGVINCLRPDDTEVREAEPEELDREVSRFRPEVVVCSRVTPVVEERVPVWVELHPDHEASSTVSVRGETETVEEMDLDGILALLDRARGADLVTLG